MMLEKHEIKDGDLWMECGKIVHILYVSSPTWPEMAFVRYAGEKPCWVNPRILEYTVDYKIN